ncbi:hypothetical protein GCM10020367_30980 [Streptomyces sannanensis]|uniref:Uncharacterized protein n=1 Tax=Streptomyces sannanensis TaxID=285536 RepID=A0ABP6SCD4_9ACTN
MSPRRSPRLECSTEATNRPQDAVQDPPRSAVGAPKGVARQGVLSALRSDPQQGDGRYPVAWLHVCAPKGAVPTATSRCACGHDRSAVGRRKVLMLIDAHTAHRDVCPLRNPQEGRTAA